MLVQEFQLLLLAQAFYFACSSSPPTWLRPRDSKSSCMDPLSQPVWMVSCTLKHYLYGLSGLTCCKAEQQLPVIANESIPLRKQLRLQKELSSLLRAISILVPRSRSSFFGRHL